MGNWPIGLSTGCFYRQSIFDCLEPIRSLGFSILEVCSFPAHLDYHDHDRVQKASDRIQELGMEPYSFHAPFADHIDITAVDETQRKVAMDEILQAARSAAILQVRYFVIHPGPERGRFDQRERFQRMENAARALNEIANHCKELGVGFVLENKLPHLSFGQTRDLLWVLGSLDTVDVGICLDTGHAYLSGELDNVVHKLSGHLWMVHASDNHGNRDDHLPPGDGSIIWEPLLRQINQSGFRGTLILEISGDGDIDKTLKDAQRGRKFLWDMSHRMGASQQ